MLKFEDMSLAQQLAWATWAENNLSDDMEHLALALIGEAGELAEIEKKRRFKKSGEVPTNVERLDELGDFWYHLRIAGVYAGYSFSDVSPAWPFCPEGIEWFKFHLNIDYLITDICRQVEAKQEIKHYMLDELIFNTACALENLGWDLNRLTLLNWWKLLSGRHNWPQKHQIELKPAEIMEQLALDTGDFEAVYQAHQLLGRSLDTEWAVYALGEELVRDDVP